MEFFERLGRHDQRHGSGDGSGSGNFDYSGSFGFGQQLHKPDRHRRRADFNCSDPGKSIDRDGRHAAVYRYGKLQRWFDAEPDEFSDLEFFEHFGRDDQQRGFGERGRYGQQHDSSSFGFGHRFNDPECHRCSADFNCGDSSKSVDYEGSYATVHGHGNVQ